MFDTPIVILSLTEENYLKAIYHLSNGGTQEVTTNQLADELHTAAASVSDMIKKLSTKRVITYKKYRGVNISERGEKMALQVIRKHRLWEVFLVEKLQFQWDEVHEIAEQLEHIHSPLLITRLDEFLGHPKIDPHGDPIPDENGQISIGPQYPISEMKIGANGVITAVENSSSALLQHLDKLGIRLGIKFTIKDIAEFDNSLEIKLETGADVFLSKQVSDNLLVRNI